MNFRIFKFITTHLFCWNVNDQPQETVLALLDPPPPPVIHLMRFEWKPVGSWEIGSAEEQCKNSFPCRLEFLFTVLDRDARKWIKG